MPIVLPESHVALGKACSVYALRRTTGLGPLWGLVDLAWLENPKEIVDSRGRGREKWAFGMDVVVVGATEDVIL